MTLKNIVTLKSWLGKIAHFDRLHTSSYRHSTVTKAPSCIV